MGNLRLLLVPCEPPHDVARRLDGVDPRHTAPSLPVVLLAGLVERGVLELPERLQSIYGAHELLAAAAAQHPARDRTGLEAHALDEWRVDDRHRHAGDPLAQHDVT